MSPQRRPFSETVPAGPENSGPARTVSAKPRGPVVPADERSVQRVGAMIRAERLSRAQTLVELAIKAGVNVSTLSELERGQRGGVLDLADRVLAAMGLRLDLHVESLWADIDAASPPTVSDWPFDLTAYLTFLDGVPFMIDGLASAALQAVPVPVDVLQIAAPADDEIALKKLTAALVRLGARRGDGYEDLDPRAPGSEGYRSFHGPLRIRLVTPFERVLWVDIDPLPEPRLPLFDQFAAELRVPLPRVRVALMPIGDVEASDVRVRRMLERIRLRSPDSVQILKR